MNSDIGLSSSREIVILATENPKLPNMSPISESIKNFHFSCGGVSNTKFYLAFSEKDNRLAWALLLENSETFFDKLIAQHRMHIIENDVRKRAEVAHSS